MTKKDLENFVRSNLKDLPLEEQERILTKMCNTWIPDITKKIRDRIKKSSFKCSKCGRYSLKKNFRVEFKTETCCGVTVLSDCGYGEDDLIADVTYLITYNVCPICGGFTKTRAEDIGEKNHRRRR